MTVAIETVEDARIKAPTDVLMRITSTAICGTDCIARHLEINLPMSGLERGPVCHPERSEGSLVGRARSFASLRMTDVISKCLPHSYEGRMGEVNGLVIGHEPLRYPS